MFLIKAIPAFLLISLIVIMLGFTIPSTEIYELFWRGLNSKSEVIPIELAWFVLILIWIVNYFIIYNSLKPKFLSSNKSIFFSLIATFLILALSYFGLLLKLRIAYFSDTVEEIFNISADPGQNPDISILPLLMTIPLSVTIVNSVFSIGINSYIKVDYSNCHSYIKKIKEIWKKQDDLTLNDTITLKNNFREYIECLNSLEKEIKKNLKFEKCKNTNCIGKKMLKDINIAKSFFNSNEGCYDQLFYLKTKSYNNISIAIKNIIK